MWWSSLFTDMRPSDFFNFSFLPKYGTAFVRGIEYTLLLAVVSVLLAVIPAHRLRPPCEIAHHAAHPTIEGL